MNSSAPTPIKNDSAASTSKPKSPVKLVANPFFKEKGPIENIAFMDYEVSGNETESTMETGSENAASTSHPTSQEMDVQQAEVLNLDDSD